MTREKSVGQADRDRVGQGKELDREKRVRQWKTGRQDKDRGWDNGKEAWTEEKKVGQGKRLMRRRNVRVEDSLIYI